MLDKLANRWLLENLRTAILWFDKDFHLRYINPAGEALLQVSSRQVIGQHARVIFPSTLCFERLVQTNNTVVEYNLSLPLQAGRDTHVDCSLNTLSHPSDRYMNNYLVELIPIEYKRHLNQASAQSQRAHAAHDMLRGLAHEIKNPLGGIRGAAQLLAGTLPEPDLQEYTDVIIEEADRLQNLLNQMLGSRKPAQPRLHNVHKTLCRIVQLLSSENDNVNFIADYDPSIPDVLIDVDQLHQVLLNLMRNALQALEQQQKSEIRIRTRVQTHTVLLNQAHKMSICIDIEDNGPGIPEDMQETIFYPMVSGRVGGSGLGLSIAQDLIQQNGGLISFETESGRTCFSVIFPILKN